MATIQNKSTVQNTQDFITIQDLFYLCLDKWHWFAISLALCLGVATFYLLRTPSVYVRTASILIKDDSKGKSSSTDMESFSDLGLFTTNTNVYNEMGTLKSPDIMREVVSRLHLEMNYQTDGRFHKQTVYGNQLPVQVVIPNLSENESATFELHLAKDGAVELSSFTRNGTEIENDGFVKGNLNDSIQSPLGPIVVIPSAAYSDKTVSTIYVTRQSLSAASAGCSARLNISQNDEKSNIITLSFQDVSTQRAEDVLNTLISVYNENWVRDKNQIAVSTSMFINERLGVIEGELGNVDDDISSFKSEHLLPDVQAAANMYMTQANEANAAIRELNNQAYMARYIKNYLTNENNKHQLLPANSGIENASLATQLNEYNTKLLERNSLVSHSSAKNPLVREMDKSLDDMRSALITSIDNQMVALRAQIRSLEAIGGQATSQIASNPKQSKYLLSVERQQKVKESLYLYLLQKREENELSQAFTAYNTRIITKPGGSMIPTAPMFINERLGVIEGELGNVDDDISSFKSEHLLPDVQAAANMYMTQANEANAAIRELNNQAYMARYIKNYLTNENNKHQLLPANSGIENASLATQLNEYNTKLLERNSLVSHSSAKNPLVREMDKSLDDMRSALITSIDNQMVALRAQIRSLEAIGGQATSQIASNPKQSKYLLSVERQQKVKESLYLYLLQKREENELSQAFTAYNTRIITKPGGSMIPTAPVKKNIFLVAFALGILIPVVIIFIRENMNTRVRGRKDLDGLSVPFIGEIPLSIRGKKRVKSYEAHTIVVKEGSRDIMNEAFRVLRTNLEFMIGKDQSSNVIVVTSFNPGSGKSFLTMNIAISLAIKNKKVLVIDGDLRHASASAYIHSPKIGLSNYLGGHIDKISDIIVTNEQHPSFSFIPVGTIPPNPTELLFDDRLQKAIHTLKQQYDVVLIDCPPVELVADTQIIEKLADRTVFVVRAGLLERSMLPELENIYREKKYKNMSVILNGTEGSGGRYGYRYGYQYGYGSGSYYGNNDRSK